MLWVQIMIQSLDSYWRPQIFRAIRELFTDVTLSPLIIYEIVICVERVQVLVACNITREIRYCTNCYPVLACRLCNWLAKIWMGKDLNSTKFRGISFALRSNVNGVIVFQRPLTVSLHCSHGRHFGFRARNLSVRAAQGDCERSRGLRYCTIPW